MKNIVLLGASNSQMMGGFKEAFWRDDVNFSNLSTGGMGTLAKIYELKRPRNAKAITEADLIILETNIVDYYDTDWYYPTKHTMKEAARHLWWLSEELFALKKKILFLVLAMPDAIKTRKINNLYKSLAKHYGFNIIDVFSYYKKAGVQDFYMSYPDWGHQLFAIMQEMGKNIVENLEHFSLPKTINFPKENPNFAICTIEEMMHHSKIELESFNKKDFFYDEKVYRLTGGG